MKKVFVDAQKPVKKVNNFWNHIHFHPTDAIEDVWGQRILDSVAADRAAKMVRIYAMLEDIVYEGENEYVYGAKIDQYGKQAYLYIGKSLHLLQTASRQMVGRTALAAIFILR